MTITFFWDVKQYILEHGCELEFRKVAYRPPLGQNMFPRNDGSYTTRRHLSRNLDTAGKPRISGTDPVRGG